MRACLPRCNSYVSLRGGAVMFSSPGCPGESGGPSELRVLGAIGRHFVELAWLGGRRAWGRLVEAGWCVSLQVLRGGPLVRCGDYHHQGWGPPPPDQSSAFLCTANTGTCYMLACSQHHSDYLSHFRRAAGYIYSA